MLSRENVMREALSEMETSAQKPKRRKKSGATRRSGEALRLRNCWPAVRSCCFPACGRRSRRPNRRRGFPASMKDQMERDERHIRRELVKSGLSADYLQPVYRCPLCKIRDMSANRCTSNASA